MPGPSQPGPPGTRGPVAQGMQRKPFRPTAGADSRRLFRTAKLPSWDEGAGETGRHAAPRCHRRPEPMTHLFWLTEARELSVPRTPEREAQAQKKGRKSFSRRASARRHRQKPHSRAHARPQRPSGPAGRPGVARWTARQKQLEWWGYLERSLMDWRLELMQTRKKNSLNKRGGSVRGGGATISRI